MSAAGDCARFLWTLVAVRGVSEQDLPAGWCEGWNELSDNIHKAVESFTAGDTKSHDAKQTCRAAFKLIVDRICELFASDGLASGAAAAEARPAPAGPARDGPVSAPKSRLHHLLAGTDPAFSNALDDLSILFCGRLDTNKLADGVNKVHSRLLLSLIPESYHGLDLGGALKRMEAKLPHEFLLTLVWAIHNQPHPPAEVGAPLGQYSHLDVSAIAVEFSKETMDVSVHDSTIGGEFAAWLAKGLGDAVSFSSIMAPVAVVLNFCSQAYTKLGEENEEASRVKGRAKYNLSVVLDWVELLDKECTRDAHFLEQYPMLAAALNHFLHTSFRVLNTVEQRAAHCSLYRFISSISYRGISDAAKRLDAAVGDLILMMEMHARVEGQNREHAHLDAINHVLSNAADHAGDNEELRALCRSITDRYKSSNADFGATGTMEMLVAIFKKSQQQSEIIEAIHSSSILGDAVELKRRLFWPENDRLFLPTPLDIPLSLQT